MPPTPDAGDAEASVRARRRVGSGALIAGSVAVMNLATYGFTILAARLLGPAAYGGVAAVMNLLLVVSVLALALQATAARRISSELDHVGQIERGVLRVTWRAALALGLALLLLAPVVMEVLRLESVVTAVLVACTAVPLTVMGGQAGVLQGERRWLPLGLVYLASGVPRLAIGAGLLLWRPEELLAVLAVAVGSVAPVLVGWWALRPERAAGVEVAHHRGRDILTESLVSSQALLAFLALANLDIVVARNVLSAHDSGLYAGGLILTKAVLFLPQFVVVVAFPSLATADQRWRALAQSLLATGLVGALGTLACWVLPELALVFVGGEEYAEIAGRLWLFALLGTVLAGLQLLVFAALARQSRRTSVLLWGALLLMLALGAQADSLGSLVGRVIAVDGLLLGLLIVLSGRRVRRERLVAAQTG